MSSSRQTTLLAALQRTKLAAQPPAEQPPTASAQPPQAVSRPTDPSPAASPQTGPARIGKPVQFWMHEEDRKLIRELAAWMAGQGIRPSDSMIVRAALRMVKTGPGFLEAYHSVAVMDGRLKESRRGRAR